MSIKQLALLLIAKQTDELRVTDILSQAKYDKFTVEEFGDLAIIKFESKPTYVISSSVAGN